MFALLYNQNCNKGGADMNLSNKNKFLILRHEYNLTQDQVAEELGISKSTYCRIEKGQIDISVEALKKLLNIYNITFEDFYNIKLPLVSSTIYPPQLLSTLEKVIKENSDKTDSWIDNLKKYENLKNALNPVLEVRNKALCFPDIDISELPNSTIVKQVKLDPRAEFLIDQCIKAQQKLLEPK